MGGKTKNRVFGGGIAFIGWLLSPLSWWNDLFVNIPIAYAAAFLVGLLSKPLFLPTLIVAYWITNVLGFVLMHYGAVSAVKGEAHHLNRKEIISTLLISSIYTVVVMLFAYWGWVKFPTEYFA